MYQGIVLTHRPKSPSLSLKPCFTLLSPSLNSAFLLFPLSRWLFLYSWQKRLNQNVSFISLSFQHKRWCLILLNPDSNFSGPCLVQPFITSTLWWPGKWATCSQYSIGVSSERGNRENRDSKYYAFSVCFLFKSCFTSKLQLTYNAILVSGVHPSNQCHIKLQFIFKC